MNISTRSGHRGLVTSLSVLLSCIGFLVAGNPAWALDVYLNELTIQSTEMAEIYNAEPDTVDVSGWTVEGTDGSFVIPPGSFIPPGGYFVILDLGDVQDDTGGQTSLLDEIIIQQDKVHYGQQGSAPLPPPSGLLRGPTIVSLARAPDASFGAPPPPDPLTDGLVWTLDFTPTFGRINDAPNPNMGSTVVLNEVDPKPEGTGDFIELYNPTAFPVPVFNWILTNGLSQMLLNGLVPPNGFLFFPTDPGFEADAVGLLYLFDADSVRVDQLGFHDGPPLDLNQCYARCPDGAGPNLGFDFPTSGGSITFFAQGCTPNAPNASEGGCTPSPTERMHWGSVKHRYR